MTAATINTEAEARLADKTKRWEYPSHRRQYTEGFAAGADFVLRRLAALPSVAIRKELTEYLTTNTPH